MSVLVSLLSLNASAGDRLEFRQWLRGLSDAEEANYFPVPRPTGIAVLNAPKLSVVIGIVYQSNGSPLAVKVLERSGNPELDAFFQNWVAKNWRLPTRYARIDGLPTKVHRRIIVINRALREYSGVDWVKPNRTSRGEWVIVQSRQNS
jgi:hypothetical protein